MLFSLPGLGYGETVRLGLWHEAFTRDGPGILLRDLHRKDDALLALVSHIEDASPDILVLTKIDFDAQGRALEALNELIDGAGYDFRMPLRSNEGVPSGEDLNGDGRIGGPDDAHGYGTFPGSGGLAVLSRFPIDASRLRSFNDLLWKDLPGTHMLKDDAGRAVQRLSSGGHWVVPIDIGGDGSNLSSLSLLISHAVPPVFDGPEDRNGRRNLDELRLWSLVLDGAFPPEPNPNAVFMAQTNLDPDRGEGYRHAMSDFLRDEGFQDPLPDKPTAHWKNPHPMRVSYLLPSTTLLMTHAKLWPLLPNTTHHLITVDISLPDPAQP